MSQENARLHHPSFFQVALCFVILWLVTSCEPQEPEDIFYDYGTPPMETETYSIDERSNIHSGTYAINIRWHTNRIWNLIELCNFGDRKITVLAYLLDGDKISIPSQHFEIDYVTFYIHQGVGTLSSNGIKLNYWATFGDKSISSEIEGTLSN